MKLIFDEPGSELATELWDRAEIVMSSQLVYPEARAAAAAAHRSGRVDARTLGRAVSRIDGLHEELTVIGLDRRLAYQAGALAQERGLRGYDAVHLASALSIDSDALVMATWDDDLARATIASGCPVAPPPRR